MITDDLISFIKKDLKIFGLGVLFFLILTLGIIFRNKRWIILPILCCASSAVAMMGLLFQTGGLDTATLITLILQVSLFGVTILSFMLFIPVVRVVVPGLEGLDHSKKYVPGRRAKLLLRERV